MVNIQNQSEKYNRFFVAISGKLGEVQLSWLMIKNKSPFFNQKKQLWCFQQLRLIVFPSLVRSGRNSV